MSPHYLALRTLLTCRARSVLAVLLIGAALCLLDLFAGQIASTRAAQEQRHVVEQRFGHLSVLRMADAHGRRAFLSPDEVHRARRLIAANRGVALALPQMSVQGVASTDAASTVFRGEGILPLQPAGLALPGQRVNAAGSSIALSRAQARTLGVHDGDVVTLAGASVHAPSVALQARVMETVPGERLLMPLAMAQSLHNTRDVERIVVFLHDPEQQDQRRAELGANLRMAGLPVEVRTWQEESPTWQQERRAIVIAFDSIAGMVFAVIAATIAATMSISVLERRREVGTLRALGMRSSSVFWMFLAEALGMALCAVVLSAVTSALLAWGLNRIAADTFAVELDGERMAMAVVAVLAVTLLAALVPAFKAARAPIAPALTA